MERVLPAHTYTWVYGNVRQAGIYQTGLVWTCPDPGTGEREREGKGESAQLTNDGRRNEKKRNANECGW